MNTLIRSKSISLVDTFLNANAIKYNQIRWDSEYTTLVLGSIISGIGLATNSPAVVIGSMLISPIGTPIFRNTFYQAAKLPSYFTVGSGLRIVTYPIIALLIGYMMGAVANKLKTIEYFKNDDEYPTNQMKTRGVTHGVAYSALLAAFIGILGARSFKSNDTMSLIGLAMAVSLLPPLINAGMLYYQGTQQASSDEEGKELIGMSRNSFLIYFVNLIFVYLFSLITFKTFDLGKFKIPTVKY